MMRSARFGPAVLVAVCLLLFASVACAAIPAEKVPDFQVRVKLRTTEGQPPEQYTVSAAGEQSVTVAENQWSEWLKFGRKEVKAALGGYPNSYSRSWPMKFGLSVRPVKGIVHVELQSRAEDQTDSGEADLTGGNLGLAVWRDDEGTAHVSTLGSYNQRHYWSVIDEMELDGPLPQKILIADRFIPGDSDLTALKEGIHGLRQLGLNVLMTGPKAMNRRIAWDAGFRKVTWAIYNPPGYAFDFGGEKTSEGAVREWARGLFEPFGKAGFRASDFSMYIMSDEPGWYYPAQYEKVNGDSARLALFHEYLRQQKLSPKDLGADSWEQVRVIGRADYQTLPEKRLYYWSQRYFPRASAEHFATASRAMQQAFHPGMPSVTNWNFFAGRSFVPGPVANNSQKDSPNAAMGGHDWFEFCRVGGTLMPWTEDWFGDEKSFQWSYYSEKLRSASMTGEFGGYVIPRTAGSMEDGITYKMMSLVGHGAKELKFFVFGPEYNFPGNCWSQNTRVFKAIARTCRLIGASEQMLYPGESPQPRVGLLHHLSSQMWDLEGMEIARGISGATNTNMHARRVAYTAELFDIYLGLMHRQVPVEFISEGDAAYGDLGRLDVIYLTQPNVPVQAQERLAAWVSRGGVLVTTSGAAGADRYNEPSTVLEEVRGVTEAPRDRLLLANLGSAEEAGSLEGEHGEFQIFGPKGTLELKGAEVIGRFDDGSPAVTLNRHGEGAAVHFALLPGISYRRSAKSERGRFPEGFSEAARSWINFPVELAGVQNPVQVDRPMVEAPMLQSEDGVAVTLLNWTNQPQEDLTVRVRNLGPVKSVRSVRQGQLDYREEDGSVQVELPLENVDVLLIQRQ